MKNFFIIHAVIFTLFLSGCSTQDSPVSKDTALDVIEIKPDDLIKMDTLDDYMNRIDVQYVDLRNFEAKFRSGYIDGFEMIPFFDYLDFNAFERDGTYDFKPDQIRNETLIRSLFDEEKAIFFYADGCIRGEYMKDLLYFLGYERVYVLGGFFEYDGAYKVLGDGTFDLGTTEYKKVTLEDGTTYHVMVVYDLGRMILDIRFDITTPSGVSYRSENYHDIDYNLQLTILENYIEDDLVTSYLLYDRITDELDTRYDEIPGYTLGFNEDFMNLLSKIAIK